jgi:ribose transport system substrate-binding protein
MMKKTRFLFVVLVIVAGIFIYRVVSTPAPGKRTDVSAAQPKHALRQIGVIPKGTTHDFWKAVHAGALKAGKEMKVEILWNGPSREGDRDGQIGIVEDFIVHRVNGIVLAPLDSNALVPSVLKVHEAKIPCVIFDSGIKTEKITSFVATDNFHGGVLAARRMAEILGRKGKVIVVQYMAGSDSTTQRENGFLTTIKREFPDIKIVDKKYGMDTVETALQATEDLLTRNPSLDGIFACNESTAVGTLRALESQGRAGKVKMVGFDSSAPLVAAVKSGKVDSLVVQNPFKMGYLGVKAVVDKLDGKTVDKRIDTGVTLITKLNLETKEIQNLIHPK